MNFFLNNKLSRKYSLLILCCAMAMGGPFTDAAPPVPLSQFDLEERPEKIVRLFWQDRETDELNWADVVRGNEWELAPAEIYEFPELDSNRQNLVQMEILDHKLLVGVRDDENGNHQSGWVAIDTGVVGHSHGDHYDWHFEHPPEVIHSQLDADQGNPAHLYTYDGNFYLANDSRNGFSQISPMQLSKNPRKAGQFFSGGGNHITMAAVKNRVCYSTWIDGGGPNAGRVDVVNLKRGAKKEIAYSFSLPTGVIHGATANSGRVFFAPADGICWVDADLSLRKNAETIKINHLELGTDPETEKPLRTGAFTNYRNTVLFNTGSGESADLCLLDAQAKSPEVQKVSIDTADGLTLTTPEVVFTAAGKRYAFLFQDRKAGEGEEYLTVIDLDPNGDRELDDAEICKTIPVGSSALQGHYGHHAIAFDSDRKYAFLTNSGDGSIWVLSLIELEVLAKLEVGGKPDHLLAIGARNRH